MAPLAHWLLVLISLLLNGGTTAIATANTNTTISKPDLGRPPTTEASSPPTATSVNRPNDPCAKIAGKPYVPPADALACYKSFPFNETLRQNVLTNMARVFDFFTFENYYLNSPPPFQDSTIDIRKELAEINRTEYATDYDFNIALYKFTTQLNDGHTRYFPSCYTAYQSLLPAPIVSLSSSPTPTPAHPPSIYVIPDLVEFISLPGPASTSHFDTTLRFPWRRLAGARVLSINGVPAYTYVDRVAREVSGNYLDHGVRVNSVFSSYRISGGGFSQRFGDLAGPTSVEKDSVRFELVVEGGKGKAEVVDVPYYANFVGVNFTDSASYWTNNCLANENTNGIDIRDLPLRTSPRPKPLARASIIDLSQTNAVALPDPYIPTAPSVASDDVIQAYILPGTQNHTGVIFVGSFSPRDYYQFQSSISTAITAFRSAGVTRLLVDLTGNGGGYVCLGQFLHKFLVGRGKAGVGYPGFVSTQRGNALARKIVKAHVAMGDDDVSTFYSPNNWAFLNDTVYPTMYDYDDPVVPLKINGWSDPTSQRFHDTCESSFIVDIPENPSFDAKNIAIVTNGNCASTCAMFSTLMRELHNTTVAVFGGPQSSSSSMQYKGMAGNQVLEWADLDTEIKSVGLKSDPLAPPDLLVDANFRHNWRTAWSFLDETKPIAYRSEEAQYRFAYTKETYNHPQNLWTFAASKVFAEPVVIA